MKHPSRHGPLLLWAVIVFASLLIPVRGAADPAKLDWGRIMRDYPKCVLQCGADVMLEYCSSPRDLECACSNEKVIDASSVCVFEKCSLAEAYEAIRLNKEVCNVGPRNRRSDVLPVVALEALAVLSIVLRLVSRLGTIGRLDTDDWLMVVTAQAYLAFITVGAIAFSKAFGVDITTLDEHQVTLGFKLFYFAESLYLICLTLTKICLLVFFLRIFPNDRFRKVVWAVMAMVAVSGAVFLGLQLFQCRPIRHVWEGWKESTPNKSHRCSDMQRLAHRAASCMIAQDAVIILLPFPIILRLNAGWRTKLGVGVMFSLGVLDLVTSAVRLGYLMRFQHSINPSWEYTDPLMWSGIEVAVAIMMANMPALRILFVRIIAPAVATLRKDAAARLGYGSSARVPSIAPSRRSADGGVRWAAASSNVSALSRSRGSMDGVSKKDMALAAVAVHETELELGDKIKGDVETTIGSGGGGESADQLFPAAPWPRPSLVCAPAAPPPRRRSESRGGAILVETTTVQVVGAPGSASSPTSPGSRPWFGSLVSSPGASYSPAGPHWGGAGSRRESANSRR